MLRIVDPKKSAELANAINPLVPHFHHGTSASSGPSESPPKPIHLVHSRGSSVLSYTMQLRVRILLEPSMLPSPAAGLEIAE
jgi:hypothetical protein